MSGFTLDPSYSFVVKFGVKLKTSDTRELHDLLKQALSDFVHSSIDIIPVTSSPSPVPPLVTGPTRPVPRRGTYTKGSGGKLNKSGHVLDGMLVDYKRKERDGSLWVALSEACGAYKEGDDIHISEWEYEELWEGTV